ncbi:MAG TPA: hypothetical protein VF950_06405 [Planctomycetota bacterium]
MRTLAAAILLTFAPPSDERITWYFDADTALRTAERSGRPIVLLKVRADIGQDVKT